MVLPSAAYVEREGTWTNVTGRVQRFWRAVLPRAEARADWEIVAALARALGQDWQPLRAANVFRDLAAASPAFAGLSYGALADHGAPLAGARVSAVMVDLGIAFARVAFIMGFVLNLGGLLTWVERKQSAVMQDRVGREPRVDPGDPDVRAAPSAGRRGQDAHEGRLHAGPRRPGSLPGRAGGVGLLRARPVSRPSRSATCSRSGGREISLQAVELNAGILFVFAMLSMGVYGVMLAGWASANNFALLGGQRAAALMISAEVAIGASIMGVCMVYGSLDLQEITRGQGALLVAASSPSGASSRSPSASSCS